MTIEYDDSNDLGLPETHEQSEEAPVTREAFLANAFMEDFFDRFAAAEASESQMFLLSLHEFDAWLVKMDLLPSGSDDHIVMRGRGSLRQEIRAMINRAAQFGKTIWPPFSIQASKKGVNYEVRLMSRHLEKMPVDIAAKTKGYLENQLIHWSRISKLMYSEKVRKYAPEQFMNFRSIERSIDLTLKNMVGALSNLNLELIAAAKDTTQFLASLPKGERPRSPGVPKRLKDLPSARSLRLGDLLP